VEKDDFEWVTGENLLTSYIGDHGFGLQFCRKCGSTLCGVYKNVVHGITLGCVNGDPDVVIARHIYVGSRARWELIPEGAPVFDEGVPPELT